METTSEEAKVQEPIDLGESAAAEMLGDSANMDDKVASDGVDESATPDWVKIPPNLKIPPGKKVAFMLFRGEWTEAPEKGDRVAIIWSLSVNEEKLAYQRARGDGLRAMEELAMSTIHSIDGVKADWSGAAGPGNVEKFWNEIGAKCRSQISNYYMKTHNLSTEERMDFFANCFVVRSAVAG